MTGSPDWYRIFHTALLCFPGALKEIQAPSANLHRLPPPPDYHRVFPSQCMSLRHLLYTRCSIPLVPVAELDLAVLVIVWISLQLGFLVLHSHSRFMWIDQACRCAVSLLVTLSSFSFWCTLCPSLLNFTKLFTGNTDDHVSKNVEFPAC